MACKRYLPPIHLTEFLKTLSSDLIKTLGYSVENRAIEMITLGTGGTKVSVESQFKTLREDRAHMKNIADSLTTLALRSLARRGMSKSNKLLAHVTTNTTFPKI